MRRLILHVGPGRTGTSALQCMFSRSAPALLEQGVRFPAWPGMADAAAGKVTSGNGGPLVAMIAPRAATKHYTADDGMMALRLLNDEDAMTVLYSHEALALFECERLAFLADMAVSAGFIAQAAYYTRNTNDYARSVYAQWTARGQPGNPEDWESWSRRFLPPFQRHILGLRQALGYENVFVRDYDAAKQDLFDDFCSGVLGIERPSGVTPWINASRAVTSTSKLSCC